MKELFLGVVADDFTGASDAASFLVEAGVSTVMFNGVPEKLPELRDDTAAVVVAMKTRTIPAEEAVDEMLAAFRWLKEIGATQLYFKYCATFDSTAKGNIGPVADAVLDAWKLPCTILCPALPVNGRTVRDGKLYVNGIPLSESHMKNHPLTPMTESDVTKLIEMQSKYQAAKISVEEMIEAGAADGNCCGGAAGKVRYLVPEFYEAGHGDLIAETFGDLPFLTGGSGLCGALGRRYVRRKKAAEEAQCGAADKDTAAPYNEEGSNTAGPAGKVGSGPAGKALLLAGSCSKITLEQIADYKEKGHPFLQILPEKLLAGEQSAETAFAWAQNAGSGALIYSSQSPEEMRASQALGQERVAEAIEQAMSELAAKAVQAGWTRIISAGGETSGAVTRALGYDAFYIGKSVAPGVPMMTPVERPELRIVLKSGGFGQTDFFERAERQTAEN